MCSAPKCVWRGRLSPISRSHWPVAGGSKGSSLPCDWGFISPMKPRTAPLLPPFHLVLLRRLYTQAEAMCKHYKTPILLIEFDGDKAFMLQVGPGLLGHGWSQCSCTLPAGHACLSPMHPRWRP